ncbi:MAG: UbiA family prenyltransferase [Chloroflexi bacterium]|nr:UbiA family prenyltransferase [Chloroflexota bacterium]
MTAFQPPPRSQALPLGVSALAYWEVLKPRVTVLLTFLGAAAATVAAGADPAQAGRVGLAALAVFLGAGGANGLTNYLDRHVDARMRRTRGRALPSGRIAPPERALYWAAAWAVGGVALAATLHPAAALAGVIGVIASVSFRKTEATHFLGAVSSAAPMAVGWLALRPEASPTLALLLLFVGAWVLHHVWAIMLFYRGDYLQAGVTMFPLRFGWERARPVFIGLAVGLAALALGVGLALGARWGYYAIAGAFAAYNLWGTLQLDGGEATHAAHRRRFKTASYSLLCGLFTALVLDAAVG